MNKSIHLMHRDLRKNVISTQEWWDFIETQDDELVRIEIENWSKADKRLKEYKNQFHVKHRVQKFANQCGYSDVEPHEVIRKVSEKCVEVRHVISHRIRTPNDFHAGGFVGHFADNGAQEYTFRKNEEAQVFRIRLSKAKKGWFDSSGQRYVMSNFPRKFYDYNF
jgi:hypothetical protein